MISNDGKCAIKTAERAGMILCYGFTWDDGVFEMPETEQDSSTRYLDAFIHLLADRA
jgi:hypothetical protein